MNNPSIDPNPSISGEIPGETSEQIAERFLKGIFEEALGKMFNASFAVQGCPHIIGTNFYSMPLCNQAEQIEHSYTF